MAKKRRQSRKNMGTRTPVRKGADEELHRGEFVAGMARPNQLVPLDSYDDLPRARFPLLSLEFTEADEEVAGGRQGVFFDPGHGPLWWEFVDRAPTWMDPHVFIQLCKADPAVQAALAKCFKRNNAAEARRILTSLLDNVMEEAYLVYMLEMFDRARPYLADWLVRHHCYQETDPNAPKP